MELVDLALWTIRVTYGSACMVLGILTLRKNCEKNKNKTKMMDKTFTTRRGKSSSLNTSSLNNWSSNRYIAGNTNKGLGKVSYTVIVGMLTLIFGLIYVGQATQSTSFDYQISEIENEISEMTAKKEDLAVEQARLTSLASAQTSEVAANMEDGMPSGYAK